MLRLRQEAATQMSLFDQLIPLVRRDPPDHLTKLDAWLDDERFFQPFHQRYHRRLGRPSIPAETYLRMIALKHQYRLSDRQVCEMIADRLSWRRFCRIPWTAAVPHPSSLTKIRRRLDAGGGDHMAVLNEHLVRKAREEKLLKARKVRVDTTVVAADIHHPTDAGLIADGVRTITRLVKRVQTLGAAGGERFRNRTRSLKKRLLQISKVLRRRTGEAVQEVRRITAEMARIATKTVHAAEAVRHALQRATDPAIQRVGEQLGTLLERTKQVIEQTRQVNAGNLHLPQRLVSLFDPDARPIRTGKGPPRTTRFGYKVRLTESEERLITEYQVFQGNPSDRDLLIPGVTEHTRRTGRAPREAATDRGFWHRDNEQALARLGVQKISLPVKGKPSYMRRQHQRQSWFRRLQRWRAGQEGTISVLKRRYGLDRSRYRRYGGSKRWVGGVVWGYNLNRIAALA